MQHGRLLCVMNGSDTARQRGREGINAGERKGRAQYQCASRNPAKGFLTV